MFSIYLNGVIFLKDAIKNVTDTYKKENEYKYGSVTFNIKREYSGEKTLSDIIGGMVLKKVISCN